MSYRPEEEEEEGEGKGEGFKLPPSPPISSSFSPSEMTLVS